MPSPNIKPAGVPRRGEIRRAPRGGVPSPGLFRLLVAGAAVILTAAAVLAEYSDERYMGRDRKERERIVEPRFLAAESRVGQPQQWRVTFRAVSRSFTPLEESGGFNSETSLRFYVQYATGRPILLHTGKLDRIAKSAGKDFYPVYLPDGIGVFVLKKNTANSELLEGLTDGERITVRGTTRLATYDSAGRILTGFTHVAEEITPGWGGGEGDTEKNRMVDNLRIEFAR